MKTACNYCGAWHDLDDTCAGRTIRCTACGKSFIAPTDLALTGQRHLLASFPVASLVLLHYLTAGAFSVMYLNLLHERMPRLRRDDPSATVALGLCFIPVFNLYWFAFSFHRLCARINEQRQFAGLPELAPSWLAIPVGVLFACGLTATFFTTAGFYVWGIIGAVALPVFAGMVQHSINELCEQQATPMAAPVA
ncbi:MAG TPA: hypothetical protein P5572_22015 [Phycisphaerae bacterium]|nr:hypothetical protein [Phycisphaerales bacterium]HRX87712.1 hypothetical protein [Phycisphaerae bacterium]